MGFSELWDMDPYRIFGMILLLFAMSMPGMAQTEHSEVLETTRVAISSGSSKELSQLFHSSFELNIFGEEYSKSNSENVLKGFFNENPPSGFSLIHSGASEDQAISYSIGQYKTGGKNYRVLLRFKNTSEGSELYKMEFREIEKP